MTNRGLSKTVRIMKDTFNLLKRMKIYLEIMNDCPTLKTDVDDLIQEIEKFVSLE